MPRHGDACGKYRTRRGTPARHRCPQRMSRPFRPSRRRFLLPLGLAGLGAFTSVALPWWTYLHMPGSSHPAGTPPPTPGEVAIAQRLRHDVEHLALHVGERNMQRQPGALESAASFLIDRLREEGYRPARHGYPVGAGTGWNIEATKAGEDSRIVVVGAHYDTFPGSPGANDNGSGVAAVLAICRLLRNVPTGLTLRFVFFTNEEPPYFKTSDMGSIRYAHHCRERGDTIAAMICLDTVGYYDPAPGSQRYPEPFGLFLPDRGDFVAFIADPSSGDLVRRVLEGFRRTAAMPSEGACPPATVPGVSWSDHASFWPLGIPAMLITDTALLRYPHYHRPTDTPDKVDCLRVARMAHGLAVTLTDLDFG